MPASSLRAYARPSACRQPFTTPRRGRIPAARRDEAEVRDAASATPHYISQRDDQPVLVYTYLYKDYTRAIHVQTDTPDSDRQATCLKKIRGSSKR